MALSGSFSKSVGSHWKLQAEWSATQNISANTSSVTVKLYWIADSYGAVNASATKDCAIQINNGTWSTKSGSGMAKLSNGQKKQIHSYTQTINHSSNGTATFSIDAYFDAEVTLGGTKYNRIDMDEKSFTLNTIPRESKLTSSPSWTAGSNLSISISRASSSFTHTVRVYADGTKVAERTGIGASGSVVFNTTENTEIFNKLNTTASKASKVELLTYSGSTHIGTESYTGTVKSPSRSTTSFTKSWNIGTTISGKITQSVGYFTHTIQLVFPNKTFTILNKTDATDWTYNTANIASELYALTPNSNTLTGEIRIYTYFGAEQVLSYAESDITAKVTGSNPTFTAGQVSYADINATTKLVTGNANYIIQGQSDLTAYVNSVATAKNSATMKTYEISINGKTEKLTTTGSKPFGKINASSNITMKVKAIDSRGNSTEVSKTIEMIPYVQPIMTVTAKRTNNFEAETTISIKGSISLLPVAGANKNLITATTGVQYRYRESTAKFADDNAGWVNMTWTVSGVAYTSSNVVLTLDNTKSFVFEFRVTDKLGAFKSSKTVSVGQPIMFLDSEKKSIGINTFPTGVGRLELGGSIAFNANGVSRDIIIPLAGDSTGHGLSIGGDGIVIIGSGESTTTMWNGLGRTPANENTFVTSDNHVYLTSALQNGYEERKTWSFLNNGNMEFPSELGIRFDHYGNVMAGTGLSTGGYWNVKDNKNAVRVAIPLHENAYELGGGRPISLSQFEFHGHLGIVGDEHASSAIVFRGISATNNEYILMRDANNGFYFVGDAALPKPGAEPTANAELFAKKFNVVSDKNQKENIVALDEPALSKVRGAKTYRYDHKMSTDKSHRLKKDGIELKTSIGLLAQEAPPEITTEEGTGIDLYAMNTMLWKAVQELSDQVDYLQMKIKRR